MLIMMLLAFAMPPPGAADELEDRRAIRERVSGLFMHEQFDELERMARQFRATQERTSSGLWKLTLFYSAINDTADGGDQKAQYRESIEAKALRWANAYPGSPTPHIAYAMILVGHAWMFRGSGWSDDVKQESWKPFQEYLARAAKYLWEHKDIADADPRWYETMLTIARAENWERQRFDKLVSEATERHPYFYQIYFAAIDYLTPKWHGSKEQIEAFANFATGKTAAREGVGMYARVYWYVAQVQYRSGLFVESAVVWDKMKQGMDDVLARYPDQWNINNFAHFACLAWDGRAARELIERMQGAPIPQAWDSAAQYEQCKTWARWDASAPGKTASTSVGRGS
jgi:hypothetical protein